MAEQCVMCGRSVEEGAELYEGRQDVEVKLCSSWHFEGTHYCSDCQTVAELREKIAHDYGWEDAVTMQMFVMAVARLPGSTPWKKELNEWWDEKKNMDEPSDEDLGVHVLFDLAMLSEMHSEKRAKFERDFQ